MNDTGDIRPIPIDWRAYVDDRRAALKHSSPCVTCGSPDPAQLFVEGCSDCRGPIVIEDHGGYVVVAERASE
jgi:hypothetical protein